MKALLLEALYAPKFEKGCKLTAGSDQYRQPRLTITDLPDPQLLSEDEVIVKTHRTGICGSDVHCVEADEQGYIKFSGPTKLPCVIGHELSGEIVEKGAEVKDLHIGQFVSAESIEACFNCANCRAGHLNVCENIQLIGLTKNGAFAPYLRLKARHVYPIGSIIENLGNDMGLEIASLLEPVGVAYNSVLKSPINNADTIVVIGAGPIGLGVIGLAKMFGAKVYAFDIIEQRVKLAQLMGADFSYNLNLMEDYLTPAQVILETSGRLATKVFDATGDALTFSLGLECLAGKGEIIYLGRTNVNVSFDPNVVVSKELKIIGSRGHAGYNIFPSLIKWIADGKLQLGEMITSRFAFNQVLEAFEQSKQRIDGKIIVNLTN